MRMIALIAFASLLSAGPAALAQSLDAPEGPTFDDRLPKKNSPGETKEFSFEKTITIEREKSALAICSEGAASGEDLESALAACDAAVAEDPESGDAYYYRGIVFSELENYPAAEADFSSAIKIGGGRQAEAYYRRGAAREQQRRLREAAADFKKAHELAPDWSAARRKVEEYQWAYE